MSWQPNPYTYIRLLTATITGSVVIAAWQRCSKTEAISPVIAMFASAWAAMMQAVNKTIFEVISKISWTELDIGIVTIPIVWLVFSLLFWKFFRHKLPNLIPVARDWVVDSMNDAMLTLDINNRVLDANVAALKLLNLSTSELLGKPLVDFLPRHKALFQQYIDQLEAHDEIRLSLGEETHWYDLRISPLYDRRHQLQGRVIVLHDISGHKQLDASLTDQIRRVNQLLEVARATTQSPSLDATMQNSLSIAKTITHADAGSLLLVNEQGDIIRSTLTGDSVHADTRERIISYMTKERLIDPVLQKRETLLIENTHHDPNWPTMPEQSYETGSALGIPIHYGERLLGGLILLHTDPYHFTPEDAEILEVAARQMAMVLANAQTYEAQRLVAEQQTMLFDVLHALQRPMHLKEAMIQATEVIAHLTGWPVVAILTADKKGELDVNAASGWLAERVLALPLSHTTGENRKLNSEKRHYPSAKYILDAIPDEVLPSVLIIPLESAIRRMLLVAADDPMAFEGDSRMLANSLGSITALILRNALLYESVSTEQQRLAALIQASRDGIIMVGTDNRVLVINQMAMRYLGLETTAEVWLYSSVMEILNTLRIYAPEAARSTLKEMRRLKNGDTQVGEGEYQIGGRTLRWLNLPVIDGERALGRLVILYDITEERQIAQMREDLTHTMVHDMRNPLTGIHSALWLLHRQLKHTIPTNYHTLLDISLRSTEQLVDLVNAILDISRLESGYMPLELTIFALADMAQDIITMQATQAEQKGIQIINRITHNLPLVRADQNLINRVLQNLVGNALKFTPNGGIVLLTTNLLLNQGNKEPPARKIQVSISDTGPGIPEKIKEQLFQKFVTGQQVGSGSGLGLAFCKMVLEAHNERIWADSTPGEGATFTFTLSIADKH
ncbi:MAG: GAF domain-containing protein [Anaerolineae bacterium]|nr:GAF domain-containing protein [Anaerolineae bacterium]